MIRFSSTLLILAKVIRIPIQPALADLSSARLQAALQSMEQASAEQARMDDSIYSGFFSFSEMLAERPFVMRGALRLPHWTAPVVGMAPGSMSCF